MSNVQKMPGAEVVVEKTDKVKTTGSSARDSFVSVENPEQNHKNANPTSSKPYVVNKAARKTKCRGPKKTCPHNNQIEKGTVRFGSRAEIDGRESVFWRHLECVTKRMLTGKGVNADTLDKFIDFEVQGSAGEASVRMQITRDEETHTKEIFRALFGIEPPKNNVSVQSATDIVETNKKRTIVETVNLDMNKSSSKKQKVSVAAHQQ